MNISRPSPEVGSRFQSMGSNYVIFLLVVPLDGFFGGENSPMIDAMKLWNHMKIIVIAHFPFLYYSSSVIFLPLLVPFIALIVFLRWTSLWWGDHSFMETLSYRNIFIKSLCTSYYSIFGYLIWCMSYPKIYHTLHNDHLGQ